MDRLIEWADRRDLKFSDPRELIAKSEVRMMMELEIQRELSSLAKFEIPKKVLLLEQDFSIEAGDMTPTLKVKRRVVEKKHQASIEALYEEGDKEGRDSLYVPALG
jgi:long-chain acyl-CoA synthetase